MADEYEETDLEHPKGNAGEFGDEITTRFPTNDDILVPTSATQSNNNNNNPSDLPDDKLIMKDGKLLHFVSQFLVRRRHKF
jgi:hypothetical protein